MILAMTLCCVVLTACGNKAEEGSSAGGGISSGAEDSSSSDDSGEAPAEEKTLAQIYTDELDSKDFKATMIVSSDFSDDTTTIVEVCGGDYRMSVGDGDDRMEVYYVDDVMYILSYWDQSYMRNEEPDEMYRSIDAHSYTMGVEEDYVFIGSEETADGLICETYHAPDLLTGLMPTSEEDGEATVYKYYFKSGETIPVRIDMIVYGMTQSTAFSEFSFDVAAIELPDLSDWTDNSETIYDEPAVFE